MRLRERASKSRKPKSGELLGERSALVLEPDLPWVKQELIKLKEGHEQALGRDERRDYLDRKRLDQENHEFIWYCRTLLALRILFPKEPELGTLRKHIGEIPWQKRQGEQFKEDSTREDDWEYIVLLNSSPWREKVAEGHVQPPSAAEFLHAFTSFRKEKKWQRMMKVALAATEVRPETASQIKTALQAVWPEMMRCTWGNHWYELDVETVALGVLVDPGLRSSVDIHSPQYTKVKNGTIMKNDWFDFSWIKIIEAEEAGFDEKHNLVVKSGSGKPMGEGRALPERSTVA